MYIPNQPAPEFQSKHFDVDVGGKSISQEASTLGLRPGQLPYGRFHKDDTVGGLNFVSSDKEQVTTWELDGEDSCGGDVAGWRFRPSAVALKKCSALEGWRLLIIND